MLLLLGFRISLKEIISKSIIFFETLINYTLYGIGKCLKKKENLKNIFKGLSKLQHSAVITDVLKREFPICDVAGGQFGKPSVLTKGNPHL